MNTTTIYLLAVAALVIVIETVAYYSLRHRIRREHDRLLRLRTTVQLLQHDVQMLQQQEAMRTERIAAASEAREMLSRMPTARRISLEARAQLAERLERHALEESAKRRTQSLSDTDTREV